MPVPPPRPRIARVNTSADDIIASRPPRTVIRDEDYHPGMDADEIFDAPMPMSTDEWDSPVIGGNFYNDDIPVTVHTVPAADVTRGVHIPNRNAEPLPDPRRRVARVNGGLLHTPVEAPAGGGFNLTPAKAAVLGMTGLAGGLGIYEMMNAGNEEEQRRQQYQQQQMMMQQRGY